MQNQPQNRKGPKSIPSQIQLSGGAVLKALAFKVVEYNPDGSPKLFELLAPNESFDIKRASVKDGTCALFADEKLLRSKWREDR